MRESIYFKTPSKSQSMYQAFSDAPAGVQITIAISTILACMVVGFGLTALYQHNKKEKRKAIQVKLHLNDEITQRQAA